MSIKFRVLGGGILGFGGGGECRFYFYGRADFSEKDQKRPRQTKPKKGQFMNFSQGHSGTRVRNVNRARFPKENTRIHTKKGEIHELFVLALFLVWFAGATPEKKISAPKLAISALRGQKRHINIWHIPLVLPAILQKLVGDFF